MHNNMGDTKKKNTKKNNTKIKVVKETEGHNCFSVWQVWWWEVPLGTLA